MANKRMFHLSLVDSDKFLEMPLSAQALYFHFGMRADDDGFLDNPKRLASMIGCHDDDIKLLIAKGYIIPFESGVICITHWRQHNTIPKDRYHASKLPEARMIQADTSKTYHKLDEPQPVNNLYTNCIQPVYRMDTTCKQNVSRDIDLELDLDLDKDLKSNNRDLNKTKKTVIGGVGEEKPKKTTENPCQKKRKEKKETEPTVYSLPLRDGTEYEITQSMIDHWAELYPDVNIMQSLRSMRGWCEANESKRKTRRGTPRFINGWLSGNQKEAEQRKGYANGANDVGNSIWDSGTI